MNLKINFMIRLFTSMVILLIFEQISFCSGNNINSGLRIKDIKRYFLKPSNDFKTYDSILKGLKSYNSHYRFFAVKSSLGIPVLADIGLKVALYDRDPAIVNLGLSKLEQFYSDKYRNRLIYFIINNESCAYSAFRILRNYDIQALASVFEKIFKGCNLSIKELMLDLIVQKKIIIPSKSLLKLIDKLPVYMLVRVVEILYERNDSGLFVMAFSKLNIERQDSIIAWLYQNKQKLQKVYFFSILLKCKSKVSYYRLYNLLLNGKSMKLREYIYKKLIITETQSEMMNLAKDILKYKQLDYIRRYAEAVTALMRYRANYMKLLKQRVTDSKRLKMAVKFFKNFKQKKTVEFSDYIKGCYSENNRLKKTIEKYKAYLSNYFLKNESALFKKNLYKLISTCNL